MTALLYIANGKTLQSHKVQVGILDFYPHKDVTGHTNTPAGAYQRRPLHLSLWLVGSPSSTPMVSLENTRSMDFLSHPSVMRSPSTFPLGWLARVLVMRLPSLRCQWRPSGNLQHQFPPSNNNNNNTVFASNQ